MASGFESLGFSVRILNALNRLGVSTIADLAMLTARELSMEKNLGWVSVMEVKKALEGLGLSLATKPSPLRNDLADLRARVERLERGR